MSYIEKSYTAVHQALQDIETRKISAETTERMVKNDEIWLGYYHHALEIHEHRVDGNRITRTKAVKPTWWQKIAGGS